jgi:transposase-like protein
MPFREVSVMDQKREFVVFATAEGANVRELCRRFGISPTTGYKLLDRYRERGLAGLIEQSRRPVRIPIQSGRPYRFDVGRRTDLIPATIPK